MVSFLDQTYTWLVTGSAGFIGSHLVEKLLSYNQRVIGLDNFCTGFQKNIDLALQSVTPAQRNLFSFIEGDICSLDVCKQALGKGVDFVLHQAALGSVPRSIHNPLATHNANVNGFVNLLISMKEAGIKSFVYASSSSVYGNSPLLPRKEEVTGALLSPYALSKWTNELYAEVFSKTYDISAIGLRYFNVFGPRQNPEGPYAAVIPIWVRALREGGDIYINGDGKTSRDFTYIDNIIEANLLAALSQKRGSPFHKVYNIGAGRQVTLNKLLDLLKKQLGKEDKKPLYRDFRPGDVRDSFADISKAQKELGYTPRVSIEEGIQKLLGETFSTKA